MEHVMECNRTSVSLFEPATYRVCSVGTLDKKWSENCGGMRIEHDIVLDQYPVTIHTGRVPDQAVLIGIIKTLFDIGCPLQSARVSGSASG
jgi:hypothetical protein